MRVITLTTDFGVSDWFVGAMKGVILERAPQVTVVDLTHAVPPGDVRAGAFALLAAYRSFPRRTVHVAVVDPDVGGPRAAIAVETADYFFVGPDNGVLSWALANERLKAVRRLEAAQFFRHPVSRTFHGRDIFAPVAASLCRRGHLAQLGPEHTDWVTLAWPQPRRVADTLQGEVIYVDHFGNAITNLAANDLAERRGRRRAVFVGRRQLCPLGAFYAAVPGGEPVAVIGSCGLLEVAIRGGHAARALGLAVGTRLRVGSVEGRARREPRRFVPRA